MRGERNQDGTGEIYCPILFFHFTSKGQNGVNLLVKISLTHSQSPFSKNLVLSHLLSDAHPWVGPGLLRNRCPNKTNMDEIYKGRHL